MSAIEWIAALFGAVSVYLSVRQNVWSWPTAIVNVGLYILVFHGARLYADMGLQVVYVVLSVYGWYHWLYGGGRRRVLSVTRITARQAVGLAALAAAAAALLGWTLDRRTDAAAPYLDSTLTAASLVAQWLMTRKVLENWIIWVVADVAYIALFIDRGLYPTAGLYAVFLVLATMGYVEWKRSLSTHQPV